MSFTNRQHARRVGLLAVPIAAIALAACAPQPAPGPAPTKSSASLEASAGSNSWGNRGGGDPVTNKQRPPEVPACTSTLSSAVEQGHLTMTGNTYTIDTARAAAQNKACSLIGMTRSQCLSALETFHTNGSTLQNQYGGPGVSVAENLFCMDYPSTGNCPSATIGADYAFNGFAGDVGWMGSAGHRANIDNFDGAGVNAAAVCRPASQGGTGVYVAVAQFFR